MADLCEALMILFFGLSWPTSVMKSYRSRTAKGKSAVFEILIWIGYVFGMIRKFIQLNDPAVNKGFLFYFAWFFYAFNMLMITIDLILYVRNRNLDAKRDKEEAEAKAKAND